MIVKDESHIIERCLYSVKPLIDKVLIVDTGSSDNTIKTITNFLERENIVGKVLRKSWENYGFNRSWALDKSRDMGCDYSLMIDADEILTFHKSFNPERFKCSLNKDYYNIPTISKSSFYYRPTLTSNKKYFEYKGSLHEYLKVLPEYSRGQVDHETEFYNAPIQDSSRNSDPQKYAKDALLLVEALNSEKDGFLRSRYTFYAAQSFKDSENPEKALSYYLKRAEMAYWEEERYISFFKAGQLKEQLYHSEDAIISAYLKAQEYNPDRAESLHSAVKYCRTCNRYQLAYILATDGIKKSFNADFLFAEMWIYDYAMLDEFAVVAYWAGHYRESYEACQKLLKNPKFPLDQIPRLKQNMVFSQKKLMSIN